MVTVGVVNNFFVVFLIFIVSLLAMVENTDASRLSAEELQAMKFYSLYGKENEDDGDVMCSLYYAAASLAEKFKKRLELGKNGREREKSDI